MTFVLRRSLPSIAGLLGLVLAVGVAFTVFLGAPPWFPAVFAIGMVGVQYAVNPFIIQWLVPAVVVEHDGTRYLTDHKLGEIVARRCRDAGVPLVRLGIVDDGTPNAFTFGRTPSDARMWVSRGLLERLDERELDAVVTHEVGHVKHWDFVVMTVAAVVPMVLYLIYITMRTSRKQGAAVAVAAYIAYVISQFVVLALSRAREFAADHWSCECTGDGDALASALVKIAYGMGQELAEEKERAGALVGEARRSRQADRSRMRTQSMRAMGIFEPREAEALAAALNSHGIGSGIDADRALAAMRWDVGNPWGKTLEKLSTHPLVARRIAALERSGLPGAPKQWSVLRSLAQLSDEQRWAVRRQFVREVFVAIAPWAVLVLMFGFGAWMGSGVSIGVALLAAGGLLVYKQHVRYPTGFQPVGEVTSLLERLDASPVAGIPVEVRGRVIGRGMPGYVLSPDLVVQDESGFVPLLYRQPLPLWATLFALFRAGDWLGSEVVARGWYRRLPGPAIELRDVHRADGSGKRARSWQWWARYAGSWLVVAVGLLLVAVGFR
jgi:Zn-dependent protease with chaperone function